MLFTFCLQLLSLVMQRPVNNGLSSATLSEPLSVTLTLEAVIFSKVLFQYFIFFPAAYKAPYFYIFIKYFFFPVLWHFQCIHTSKKLYPEFTNC